MPSPPRLSPAAFLATRRVHLARLANSNGATGETFALTSQAEWTPRPRGKQMRALLAALAADGIIIKSTSFDALATPEPLKFDQPDALRKQLAKTIFVEIKTANQPRVKSGFGGFFFALTEAEIEAAEQLESRHRVVLYNNLTGESLATSVPEILARSRSMTWQLSVQL